MSGTVVISALVKPDGKVYDARVIQSLDSDLDKAAVEETKVWLFQPAETLEGTPVPVRVAFELNFRNY